MQVQVQVLKGIPVILTGKPAGLTGTGTAGTGTGNAFVTWGLPALFTMYGVSLRWNVFGVLRQGYSVGNVGTWGCPLTQWFINIEPVAGCREKNTLK